jgi:hypothetical protein
VHVKVLLSLIPVVKRLAKIDSITIISVPNMLNVVVSEKNKKKKEINQFGEKIIFNKYYFVTMKY